MSAKRGTKNKKTLSNSKRGTRRRKTRAHPPKYKRAISTIFSRKRIKEDKKRKLPPPITGWRLWLFRVIAVTVIPALLFLLLEITLRIVGFGFPTATTIKCKVNDKASYRSNPKFAWRFFHPNVARTANPFVFPADKPNDAYRIFVLGASAAAGMPD